MHPTLGKIGPLTVHSYGFMLMLAFVAGILWMLKEVRGRDDLRPEHVIDFSLCALISSIVGARVVFVLLNWGSFAGSMAATYRLDQGGMSFHGGLLFAIAATIVYARVAKIRTLAIGDAAAPSVALGYAFARIGCFLNGCCSGAPAALPWAVRFDVLHSGHIGPPSHPTQLYASLAALLIFGLLLLLKPRVKERGDLFILLLALYCVYRFANEFLRRGVSAWPMAGFDALTQGQLVSILGFLFCAVWVGSRRRPTGIPWIGEAHLVAAFLMPAAAVAVFALPEPLGGGAALTQGFLLALIVIGAALLTVIIASVRTEPAEEPTAAPPTDTQTPKRRRRPTKR
jgi:phosphatidylglycerol:prolipoprotein diacylglycerol transferase